MVRLALWLVIALVVSQSSFAQPADRQIVDQPIEWFAVTTNWKLNKRMTYMLEGQFRYASGFQPQQYQVRTAMDISLNKHFSIVPVGYVLYLELQVRQATCRIEQ